MKLKSTSDKFIIFLYFLMNEQLDIKTVRRLVNKVNFGKDHSTGVIFLNKELGREAEKIAKRLKKCYL